MKDWIRAAADAICDEIYETSGPGTGISSDEMVAIITKHAAPLVALLREARREHYHQQHVNEYEMRGCCPQCSCGEAGTAGDCTCGADAWNARVDAALAGENR